MVFTVPFFHLTASLTRQITRHAKGSAHLAKADSSIVSLFKTATAHAVQSAFLDSFRYLNLSFLNRNLLFKSNDVMAHLI